MPGTRTFSLARRIAVACIVTSCFTEAHAAPLTVQGYTVTDLGAGSPTLSTEASGLGIVVAPAGQSAFAFPQSSSPLWSGEAAQAAQTNLPLIDTPPTYSPDTYGKRENAFAYIQTSLLNANRMAAVVEVTGVNGHWYQGDAYYTQQSPGGSWSVPTRIFLGQTDLDGSALPYHAQSVQLGISIVGINDHNQVLGWSQPGPYSSQSGPFVYNINTRTSISLGNLDGNYLNVQPIAISDDGALMLEGQPVGAGGPDHTLLLTPDGVSPSSLTVAPEPGAWTVMSLAAAGLALREHQRRRRGRNSAEKNCALISFTNPDRLRSRVRPKKNRYQGTCLAIAPVLQ
jgi:hypothetical protein